jgi:hypothetical protein
MMAQKAQQQRVCDAGRGPDTGPSTPVVITGGGTFPEDTAIPSKLYIASKQNDPPLVFEIVSAGAETEQWSQSRSVSVGFIESVLVGDKLFPVPEHPITISIVAAAGNPLQSRS